MRRTFAVGALAVACALVLWWSIFTWHRFLHSSLLSDFDLFFQSARAFLDGHDMYAPTLVSEMQGWRRPASVPMNMNPPNLVMLMAPLALLHWQAAYAIWMLASLIALGVSWHLIAREIVPREASAGAAGQHVWTLTRLLAVLLLTMTFAGMQAFLITGQLSLLLLLLVTFAWRHARHGRWNHAALILGFCLSIKSFFLIFVPYLLIVGRLRAAVITVATAVVFVAAGVIVCGVDAYQSWFQVLDNFQRWSWFGLNASSIGFVQRVVEFASLARRASSGWHPALPAGWPLMPILIGVVTLAATWRRKRRTDPPVDRDFALLLTAAQLMSPLGWVYYLILPAGPVAAMTMRAWRGGAFVFDRTNLWRKALLAVTIVSMFFPFYLQRHWTSRLMMATLWSVYFWGALAGWLWLVGADASAIVRNNASEEAT